MNQKDRDWLEAKTRALVQATILTANMIEKARAELNPNKFDALQKRHMYTVIGSLPEILQYQQLS